jgi:hypothetical protein
MSESNKIKAALTESLKHYMQSVRPEEPALLGKIIAVMAVIFAFGFYLFLGLDFEFLWPKNYLESGLESLDEITMRIMREVGNSSRV